MKKKKSEPQLERIVVVGKFSDGKCRQILIQQNTENILLKIISVCEGKVTVFDKPLENIEIVVNR